MASILSSGDKLDNGHYTVLSEIGVGGTGVVYRAYDEVSNRDVAIKVLLSDADNARSKANTETFKQEAELVAKLRHPNIVGIFDIGIEIIQGKPHRYMAMEYLPGGTLARLVHLGPLPVDQCMQWMKQITSGLSFAHKLGIVHQDIKAENIYLTRGGDVKVGDFGLARLLAGKTRSTSTVKGMGTPAYMSPELCRGEPQDYRSDIYSLGVLFFEMATGELPYKAKGMIEMAMKHSDAPVPSLGNLNSQMNDVIEKMVRRMMAKNPSDRYQSMVDILAVLEAELKIWLRSQEHLKSAAITQENKPYTPPVSNSTSITHEKIPINHSSKAQVAARVEALRAKSQANLLEHGRLPADHLDGEEAERKRLSIAGLAWSFKTNGPIGRSSMPVIDRQGKTVFVGSADRSLYAVDVVSGGKLWSYAMEAPILASPVLVGDQVFVCATDGQVAALPVKSDEGIPNFVSKLQCTVVAGPAQADGLLLFASMEGTVQAVDLKKGKVQWSYDCKKPIVAAPQILGDQALVTTKAGNLISLKMEDGTQNWSFRAKDAIITSCTVGDDGIYTGTKSGVIYKVDPESGEPIWNYPSKCTIASKAAMLDSLVVFATLNKTVFGCDTGDGQLVWTAGAHGGTVSDLVAFDGCVLDVSRDGWLQCFSGDDGVMQWHRELGRSIESTPLITSSRLFIGTIEGDLLTYNLAKVFD